MAARPLSSADERSTLFSAAEDPPGDVPAWDATERQRWSELETKLCAQLAKLAEWCDDDPAWLADDPSAVRLRQQARALARLHDELRESQQRWVVRQEWASRERQTHARQMDLWQQQLVEERADLADREAQLDKQQRKWEHALQFASQQQADLDAQRLRLRAQRRHVGATLAQRREELRRQLQEFHEALAAAGGAAPAANDQIQQSQQERDALRQRLQQAESAAAAGGDKDESDLSYELRRRFEMAVEDMRAYKHRVEELEQQLAQRADKQAPAAASGPRNWAQQKAEMLASLETDLGGTDQKSIDNRLTVEGAIRITDDVVSEKEAEIKQLKRQLEDLRTERKSAAAHDAAAAAMLDHDAVIAAERERLRKLQESYVEKQRAAEVEISVDRARLARQQVELEERAHALETDLARRQVAGSSDDEPPSAGSKSVRGRWLARLGLSNDDAAGQ